MAEDGGRMERAGATSRRETPVIVQYRAETLAEIVSRLKA
jgi:hypothetical protein